MEEKIICFSLGLSPADVEKGKASYYETNKENGKLEVIPVTKAMLKLRVEKVLDSVEGDTEFITAGKGQNSEPEMYPAACKYRMVVVNTMERQQVLQVMRSFKAVLPDPQSMIFAVITETARTWTFDDYTGHLAREHEQMMKR